MTRLFLCSLSLVGGAACTSSSSPSSVISGEPADCGGTEAVGWTEASHARFDADYDVLMGTGDLPRLDLIVCAEDFATMEDDLATLSSGGRGGDFPDATPVYVPATLVYEGSTWPSVGLRYKGNSSLYSATQSGVKKLPFRLSMDHYEDDLPDLEDQRFYGFKDLKFSSGYNDGTLQRDVLTASVFREFGVPAARGGHVAVYVDVGEGPVYWGLYGVFEDPAGELLDSWFGSDSGNAYKPDGDSATLETVVAADFENKTNSEADHSDVIAFVDALNAEGDAATWRAGLEATFDVDGFLRYLAMNNLIGNWDTYGRMTHNYYLYADPNDADRLAWIPWDFNEAYDSGRGQRGAIDLGLSNISTGWPLLERVAADPVYRAAYEAYVADAVATVFSETEQLDRINALEARIEDAANEEEAPYQTSNTSISAATNSLRIYVAGRVAAGTAL